MPTQRPISATSGLRRLLAPLLAVLLLTACDPPWVSFPPPTPTPPATVQVGTPVPVGTGPWQHLSLPVSLGNLSGYAVSPNDPDTIFLCSEPDQPNAWMFWRTTDAGAHWTHLAGLGGGGTGCAITIAPDDPQRILVQINSGEQHGQFCASDSDYLSTNSGVSWMPLEPYALNIPASAPYDWCQLEVTRDHLFLTLGSTDPTKAGSLLARSDDFGQTWTRIDNGLGNDALFLPPQIGPDGHLAMTIERFYPQPSQASTSLWTSMNAGTTWTAASDLPGYPGPFLLSSLPGPGGSWPGASHPFYALTSEQIPSALYRESVLASPDGVHWSQLPNLPIPGMSGDQHGILQSLATLSDGRLAVWGADPQAGLPTHEPQTSFWLWLWNPTVAAWQVVPTPLHVTTSESCGLCWQGTTSTAPDGSTTLYVSQLSSDPLGDPPLGLYRLRIPPRA